MRPCSSKRRPHFIWPAACLLLSATIGAAYAQPAGPPTQTETPPDPALAAPRQPAPAPSTFRDWASGITLGLQGEAGIVANTHDPDNRRNFGTLTTDNANRPVLNQALLTISRAVDPKSATTDIGFKLQALYGSDARIYQTMGVFDQLIHDRNQLALIEANVSARLPNLFANGLNIKAGLFSTPLGIEVIDPKPNAFYSHSYISNYGLPFKHAGALATAHVSDVLDLYLGVDTGSQTWIAYGAGDNNNQPAGVAGFGLNLVGGKLTILALTHIGPENSKHGTPYANSAIRYYNDVATVYKATDKLSLSLELNYARDDGAGAGAYGASGYVAYALNNAVTLNGRAEVFRDNDNFFVSTPAGNRDLINSTRGTYATLLTAAKPTTYSEFTLGVTYKPAWAPKAFTTALIRPEIRYDQTLNNSKPYGDGNKSGVFTLATDVILGF